MATETTGTSRRATLEEPAIITQGLPDGYRIIADDQDGRFYPQRTTGARFATRTALGGGHIDHPLSFEREQDARTLIAFDSAHPRPESWGSIIYAEEELQGILRGES